MGHDTLTPRERQVLLLSWFTGRQIAVRLGIAYQTVKNTRWHLYEKLGVAGPTKYQKKTRAVVRAVRVGIVDIGDFVVDHPLLR